MTNKTGHIAAVATVLMASSAPPVIAGGLLGDQPLFQEELGSKLDSGSLRTLKEADTRQAPTFFNPKDWLNQPNALPSMVPEIQSYDQLQMQKTPAQRDSEAAASHQLDIGIDNICLTATGACSVQYATKGSTCFCSTGSIFELGIIQ